MISKILVVDNNIIFCNALKYHLIQKEYDVEICISYSDFQDRININDFDLILIDMKPKCENIDIINCIIN